MAGLTAKQVEQLKQLPGIDQNLLSAYEKRGQNLTEPEKLAISKANTSPERTAEIASQSFVTPEVKKQVQGALPSQTVLDRPRQLGEGTKPPKLDLPGNYENPTDRVTKLTSGLESALAEARSQRQDSTLDMMGGIIPTGALPATSFASVLNSMNRSAAPLEASLTNQALDFAQQEQQNLADEKNQVRDLALSYIEQGGDQAGVSAILANTDIDNALGVTAGLMKSIVKDDFEIRQVGSNLLKVDAEGNIETLFSANETSGGSTKFTPQEQRKLEQLGLDDAPRQEQLDALYGKETEEDKTIEFNDAIEYAKSFNGTDEELKQDLMANSDLNVSEINSIIDARKVPPEALDTRAQELVQEYFNPSIFLSRGAELNGAKKRAKEDVENYVQNILGRELTSAEEEALKQAIDRITLDQINI